MDVEQRDQLAAKLGETADALRRALHRKKLAQAFFEAAEAALQVARLVGPLGPTLWRSLEAEDVWLDDLALYYDDAVRHCRWDLAAKVAEIFEALAPDEGGVERARVAALGKRDPLAIATLEEVAREPAKDPWARNLALGYLAEVSSEAFVRSAPEALRLALASGDDRDAKDLADTLSCALFKQEEGFGTPSNEHWVN